MAYRELGTRLAVYCGQHLRQRVDHAPILRNLWHGHLFLISQTESRTIRQRSIQTTYDSFPPSRFACDSSGPRLLR